MSATAATLAPLLPDVLTQAAWIYALAAVVAMLIAAVIKGLVSVLNTLQARAARPVRRAPTAAVVPARSVAAAIEPPPGIPAAHVAAIAAAIHALDGPYCIVRIDDLHSGGGWAAQGRSAHHHSHAVPSSHAPKH